MKQLALCEWCHQTAPVTSRAEADLWLRIHDCPENVTPRTGRGQS